MDFVAPVKTAYFPDRKTRTAVAARPMRFADQLDVPQITAASARQPEAPMVNMAMLLEILGAAGEPVNSNVTPDDATGRKTPSAANRRASLAYARPGHGANLVDTIIAAD